MRERDRSPREPETNAKPEKGKRETLKSSKFKSEKERERKKSSPEKPAEKFRASPRMKFPFTEKLEEKRLPLLLGRMRSHVRPRRLSKSSPVARARLYVCAGLARIWSLVFALKRSSSDQRERENVDWSCRQ